jgi:hypothetical protein
VFGTAVAAEAGGITLNDDVNVFRESLDEFPRFGERRAAFESEIRFPFGNLRPASALNSMVARSCAISG